MNYLPKPNGVPRRNGVPGEKNIEALLGRIQPNPRECFHIRMGKQPWNRTGLLQSVNWFRVNALPITLVLVVLLVLFLSLFSPSFEVLANRIARFFTPASNDQVQVQVPSIDLSDPEMRFTLSVEEASHLVGFPVKIPASIPGNYTFGGAAFNKTRGVVTLNYKTKDGLILRISQRLVGVEYQKISIQADVEMVAIGPVTGEYVAGGWKAIHNNSTNPSSTTTVTIQATWDSDANIHFLRWQENDILYELFFIGEGSETPGYLNKEDLITIAENLR